MNGTLYGIGLGPGDPELMTLKAARLIAAAKVVAYPALERGDSFARSIAADLIADDADEIRIPVPMSVERAPAQAAYDAGAAQIAERLEAGRRCGCAVRRRPVLLWLVHVPVRPPVGSVQLRHHPRRDLDHHRGRPGATPSGRAQRTPDRAAPARWTRTSFGRVSKAQSRWRS